MVLGIHTYASAVFSQHVAVVAETLVLGGAAFGHSAGVRRTGQTPLLSTSA